MAVGDGITDASPDGTMRIIGIASSDSRLRTARGRREAGRETVQTTSAARRSAPACSTAACRARTANSARPATGTVCGGSTAHPTTITRTKRGSNRSGPRSRRDRGNNRRGERSRAAAAYRAVRLLRRTGPQTGLPITASGRNAAPTADITSRRRNSARHMVDPWPGDWPGNWYSSDDVYVDYDDGYYLYNRSYPQERLAITIRL